MSDCRPDGSGPAFRRPDGRGGRPPSRGSRLSLLLAGAALLLAAGCSEAPEPTTPEEPAVARMSASASVSLPPPVVVQVSATDLGVLGGDSSVANDVNESGVVVGASTISTDPGDLTHGFEWTESAGLSDLSPTVTVLIASRATGVNASGQISGEAEVPAGSRDLPVVWDGGAHTVLPGTDPDDNPNGIARDINDDGVVTGSIELAGCVWTSFTSDCQRLIGPPEMIFSPHRGNAINDRSDYQIVGRGSSLAASMLWEDFDDVTIPAGDFGVFNSEAMGLNGLTPVRVVGWATTPPPALDRHAYLWTESAGTTDLGTLGGDESQANDINDGNVVVGWAENGDGHTRPFLWRADIGMTDLGTLGGDEGRARAINGSNTVVGASETAGGETHATRWTVTLIELTPPEEIDLLAEMVREVAERVELEEGVETSLLGQLEQARALLDRDRPIAATNVLEAFIREVEALVRSDRLPASEAEPLVLRARGIVSRID